MTRLSNYFLWTLISKMDVKMNFRILMKNHTADSKIRFSQKIHFSAVWTHESQPTAWELNFNLGIRHGRKVDKDYAPPSYDATIGPPVAYEESTQVYDCDEDGISAISMSGSQFLNSISSLNIFRSSATLNRQESSSHRVRTLTENSRNDGFLRIPMGSRFSINSTSPSISRNLNGNWFFSAGLLYYIINVTVHGYFYGVIFGIRTEPPRIS